MGEWHNPGNKSLHMGQEAHQTRPYPGFCNMNWPGEFSSPPWDASLSPIPIYEGGKGGV